MRTLRLLMVLLLLPVLSEATTGWDTLRVMSYNLLYYGEKPYCQGPIATYHNYLKTILEYVNPDVLGLVKAASVKLTASDTYGIAPFGFADSILNNVMNVAVPGKYAYGTMTNTAQADNMCLLFYNKQKLGYIGIVSTYSNITDFNTHKLYYKDPTLATTHDTTFLYVTLNHTESGSNTSDATIRSQQITGEMNQLHSKFSHLPNMINMGDFNLHASTEASYQTLINPTDTNYKFYEPAYIPDVHYAYPSDWDNNASSYASFLTTSTRQSSNVPNNCGTSGGAKGWYDHILLSSNIIHSTQRIQYIGNSYKVVGNDGNRIGISINDAPTNNSAPANVINALFQMSNKYPVIADLRVQKVTLGVAQNEEVHDDALQIENPIGTNLSLTIADRLKGEHITVHLYDASGKEVFTQQETVHQSHMTIPIHVAAGSYIMSVTATKEVLYKRAVVKL